MNGSLERELKLIAPDAFSLARMEPHLDAYVAAPAKLARLHTVYYDSDDFRLARWGCSLRFRAGHGWTLKLPVPREGDVAYREEHVFEGDGGSVPAAALDLATAYLRGAIPRPVAELRTVRTSRQVSGADGSEVAEVALDDVRVVDGTQVVQRFRQLEIELAKDAPDGALDALAALLRREGAGDPDPVAKNVRALGDQAALPEIAAEEPGRGARIGDVVRAAFCNSVTRLIRRDAALRLHAGETAVHDARVAVRRLRSDLRTFRPVLEEAWCNDLRERMRWLQDGFSTARDADVLLERLRNDATQIADRDRERIEEVLRPLQEQRSTAYARMRAMLREPRYAALLQELVDAAKRPPLTAAADQPAATCQREIIDDAWSVLRKRVRKRSRPPADRELHRIRIAAKRVRYAAEALAPAVGRRATRLARAAEAVQTILGDQHDAVVACERLRGLAHDDERAFIAGELAALEYRVAVEGRTAWRHAWRAAKQAHRALSG